MGLLNSHVENAVAACSSAHEECEALQASMDAAAERHGNEMRDMKDVLREEQEAGAMLRQVLEDGSCALQCARALR